MSNISRLSPAKTSPPNPSFRTPRLSFRTSRVIPDAPRHPGLDPGSRGGEGRGRSARRRIRILASQPLACPAHVVRVGAFVGPVSGAPEHFHEASGARARRHHQRLGAVHVSAAVRGPGLGLARDARVEGRVLALCHRFRRDPVHRHSESLQGPQTVRHRHRHVAVEAEPAVPGGLRLRDPGRDAIGGRAGGRAAEHRRRLSPQCAEESHLGLGAAA